MAEYLFDRITESSTNTDYSNKKVEVDVPKVFP